MTIKSSMGLSHSRKFSDMNYLMKSFILVAYTVSLDATHIHILLFEHTYKLVYNEDWVRNFHSLTSKLLIIVE